MATAYEDCPYCHKSQEFEFSDFKQGEINVSKCEDCGFEFQWYWESSIDIFVNQIKIEELLK